MFALLVDVQHMEDRIIIRCRLEAHMTAVLHRFAPPELFVQELAQAIVSEWMLLMDRTKILKQRRDAITPEMRRAQILLQGWYLEEGKEDLAGNIHTMLAMCQTPLCNWGVDAFADPNFIYRDTILIDDMELEPTLECEEIASSAPQGADNIFENKVHEELRSATIKGSGLYSLSRHEICRKPMTTGQAWMHFARKVGQTKLYDILQHISRPLPENAVRPDSTVLRCRICGGLVMERRRSGWTSSFPGLSCLTPECRDRQPDPLHEAIPYEPGLLLMNGPVLRYSVGPGIDELLIYDEMKAAGFDAEVYPRDDAADIGINGLDIGIDVKTGRSRAAIAAKIIRKPGRLQMFRRQIIAIPDHRAARNTHFLSNLKADFSHAGLPIEVTTVGSIIRRARAGKLP